MSAARFYGFIMFFPFPKSYGVPTSAAWFACLSPRVAEPILRHYKLYKTISIQVEKMSYMV